MFSKLTLVALLVSFGNLANAGALPTQDATRGELLYTKHCVTCHTTQVHWRDKHIATNWIRLQAEVRRWQKFSALGWGDADVTAVSRYLNTLYYHYPAPDESKGF